MEDAFKGKVAVVTGAGSGIGRACAVAFADQGASVVVADVNESGGQETVRQIGDASRALFVRADVSLEAEVQMLVQCTVDHFGGLDAAVNNAAVADVFAPMHEVTESQWHRVTDVTLKGVWLCMKHELRIMVPRESGTIVNISSGLAVLAIPNQSAYCAAKAGVLGLTRAAAAEYGPKGIRVNAVMPGITRTPMVQLAIDTDPEVLRPCIDAHPLGRIGEPHELAAAVTWLCSDSASFVTGHAMAVDGGFLATPI